MAEVYPGGVQPLTEKPQTVHTAASLPVLTVGCMNRKHHLVRAGLILVAVLAVAGAVGGGYAWGHSASPSSGTVAQSAPATSPPSTPKAATKGNKTANKSKEPAAHGQLTAINGDSWTVQTAKAGVVTVTVNGSTKFGTEKKPGARTDFTVGSQVAVTGTKSGDTITATRIVLAPPKPSATPAPSATPTPTPTS